MRIAIATLSVIVTLNLVFLAYVWVRLLGISNEVEALAFQVGTLVQHTENAPIPDVENDGQRMQEQSSVSQLAKETEAILFAKQKRAYGREVQYRHGDLLKILDLDGQTTNEFVEIQIHFNALRADLEKLSPYDSEAFQDLKQQRTEAVAQLLGSDFVYYQDYERTYEDRRQILFFSKDFLETSLDDVTKEQLVAELSAVSENYLFPPVPRSGEDLGTRIEMTRARFDVIKRADQEKIERARSVLTSEQFEGFENFIYFQHKHLEDGILQLEKRLSSEFRKPAT